MRKIYYYLFVLAALISFNAKAQSIHACFSATNGATFPVTQCGGFFLQLTNCSTGTYDSAVWKLQQSNNHNCTGPWGITFTTSKGGASATTGTGYSLAVDGSYKLCLVIYNTSTGQRDSTCSCIAIVNPIPVPNFTASDTLKCGGLTTTFTPTIQSGTAPFGTSTWYFGDNVIQTISGTMPISHTYTCKNTSPPCYSVTISVTDANGCAKVVTKPCMISVPCNPTPTVTAGSGNICTVPTTITFNASATSLIGHGIYTWWFPPGTVPPFLPSNGPSSSVTSVTQSYSTFGCHDVVVALKDSITGCSDTTHVHNAVCLQGISVVSVSPSVSHVCCNQPFTVTLNASTNPVSTPVCAVNGTLVATPVGGGAAITLGTVSSISPGTFTLPCGASTAITYNVCFQNGQVSNQCNNCTQSYNGCFQMVVNPSPTAQINLTAPTLASYCSKGHQFCFHASTPTNNLSGATYAWYIGSVSGTPLSSTTSFCYTFPNFGSYKIYLQVCQSAANGSCCALDSMIVSQVPPTGSFTVSLNHGCDAVCTKFTVSPATDSLYIFDFGDGSPLFSSNIDTARHCYFSNLDTCYNVTIVHISHSIGGFACSDTLRQKGAVKIGHIMPPNITMTPPVQCLVHKQACVSVFPNNPGLIPPPGASTSTCLTHGCHWYFTKPGSPQPVVQSFICDSPKVCFDDTGHFDAHYVIFNNSCPDTVFVPNAVLINGILGDFNDSLHCLASGSLTNFCVTIKSKFKIYPTPTDSTHITFIVSNGSCGASTTYNFVVAPNGPPPQFNHCFCAAGSYTITMITKNASSGCPADSTTKTITVASYHAQIDVVPTGTNLDECMPFNFCFTSANSIPTHPDNISWSFGDGQTSSSVAPCHTYNNCGAYNVKLILKDNSGTCSDSTQKVVTLHNITPNVTISLNSFCSTCMVFHNNSVYCGGTPAVTTIHFSNSSPDIIINGAWTTYNYCTSSPIGSNVQVTLTDNIGCAQTFLVQSPNIFGIEPCLTGLLDTAVCFGTSMNFVSCNPGFVLNNQCWTLSTGACNPNGTCLSTSSNLNYTFNTNGYFYLNLHLSNGYGCSADTCVRIHVQNPIAGFIGRDTIPCPGSFDTLINTTTGAYNTLIVSMSAPSINFYQTFSYSRTAGGTGIPSQVLLPLGFPADYRICWNAISTTGCSDSICRNLHVAGPIGHLTCSNVYACIGDTVCCTLITNAALNPVIKFPDGTFSILPHNSSGIYNFCHKYLFPGHQLVQAFIDDGVGCSYPLFDTVHIDGPVVNFSWTPNKKNFCGSATVTMLDSTVASLYPIDTASYKWIVFDAHGNVFATYAHKQPTISISTAGSYSIMEIVKSTFGCRDTLEKSFITIYPYPTARFTPLPDTICINQCVTFSNTSLNPDSVGGYKWYLTYPAPTIYATTKNTQYCYPAQGTYLAMLIDSSIHGCIDTSSIVAVIVLPSLTAAFTQSADSICGNSGTVAFSSNSIPNSGITWEWSFGDGSAHIGAGNFPTATHLFNLPIGVKDTCYAVKLIIRNTSGCVDSITHFVCISAIPQIALVHIGKASCNPLTVNFTDSSISLDPIINYHIDFGDGSTAYNSSSQPINFSKTYTNNSHSNNAVYISTYSITTAFGCTISRNDTFTVYPIPQAAFTENTDSLCGNTGVVNFSSSSTPNVGVSFTWNFGDGSSPIGPGNFPSPAHTYTLPNGLGTACYPTKLYVVNSNGCVDSSNHTICISVNPNPFISMITKSSCNPLLVNFKDSSNSLIAISNYYLDFGDSTTVYNSSSAPNVITHTYSNTGHLAPKIDIAKYTITTTFGCSSSVNDTFKVYPIPQACVGSTTDSVCPGVPTVIGCASIAGMHYLWYKPFGIGIFSPTDSTSNPAVTPFASTTYNLAVKNQWGCRDTDSVFVFVKGLLVPYAGRDTSVCKGGSVHLFSQGGTSYVWEQLSNHAQISTSNDFVVVPDSTTIYQAIITGDCNTDSTTVNVNVFPVPSILIDQIGHPFQSAPIAGRQVELTTTLTPSNSLGYYNWYPNQNMNCDTCSKVYVSPDVNTTYTVVFTNNYGCKDSSEITIYVLCDKSNSIYVPNAFEPTSSATSRNAFFYVQGTGIKELNFLRVYNRWGTQVFNAEHVPINKPEAGWDGTYNGVKVNIDVYMYQMQVECANGSVFPIAGNVTIIR